MEQTRAIREWANASGYEVSDRGRFPAAVVERSTPTISCSHRLLLVIR
ncbi:Lsr2 family DNA-binding protein [Rhodococcus sp. NBC_00297]